MNLLASPKVQNVGELDRGIRALLALAQIALIFSPAMMGWPQIALIAMAIIFAVSSYTGYCFIYNYLGWCSCENGRPIIHHEDEADK